MADITVSYEEMNSSVTRLNQGKASIEEQLTSLMSMIDQLVAGPFKTQAASGRFQESYRQWNDGAKSAISGLEGMSSFLTQAVSAHQELDSGLASGLG